MRIQELLEAYFQDPRLDEVLINSHDQALLLCSEERRVQTSPFHSPQDMIEACQQLAWSQNLRLDPLLPAAGGAIDATVAGKLEHFRWHCLLPPVSRDGPLLSLRRHRLQELDLKDFADSSMMPHLEAAVHHSGPLFIAGPTGAGKTSLLMALLRRTAGDQRVAILEQNAELPRLGPGWIRLQAQAPDLGGQGAFRLQQGFDELLRLRPDRIVIGELRQQEDVQAVRRAMLAGHGSVWTTLHVGTPEGLASRLADLAQEAERIWREILHEQRAQLILMDRAFPRVRGLWVFDGDGVKKKTP